MIKRLSTDDCFDGDFLLSSYYGRKIFAYLRAYGTEYDFCKFYSMQYGGKHGYMFIINSTLVIAAGCEADADEIAHFIEMYLPYRVEVQECLLEKLKVRLSGYKYLKRTKFGFTEHMPENFDVSQVDENPKLDDVYKILKESFPHFSDYGLWLTDTSHRIRRGTSKVYMYRECTTATVIYDEADNVLIGQVATMETARGKGYARELLYWLGHKMRMQGKTVSLFALDYRESFYREIGFSEISIESVLERAETEKL